MNMGYLLIYLCLWFLSSVSCSFHSRDLSPQWLNLFLCILFFFDTTVNGIGGFISFSENLLLAYKNATYFYMLILYPATSLNSWIKFNSFFGWIFRIFYMKIMSSTSRGNFTSFFPILILFFSCPIALARTSVVCWARVLRVGSLVLFLIIEEILSNFRHWVC